MEDAFHLQVVLVQKAVLPVRNVAGVRMLTMEAQTAAAAAAADVALTKLQSPELVVVQTALMELAEVEQTAVVIRHATHQTAAMAEEWESTTQMIVASVAVVAEVLVEEERTVEEVYQSSAVALERSWRAEFEEEHYAAEEEQTDVDAAVASDHVADELARS